MTYGEVLTRPSSGVTQAFGLVFALALATNIVAVATPARAGDINGVGSVCENVVRLHPGEAHYAACVQSLSDSARAAHSRVLLQQADTACRQRFASDTPALAECVLNTDATASDPAPDRTAASPGGTRSWYAVSPGVAFRREQTACAAMGFDPVDGAFSACSADLHAALAAADNPMN